jgi:hypothetical protein
MIVVSEDYGASADGEHPALVAVRNIHVDDLLKRKIQAHLESGDILLFDPSRFALDLESRAFLAGIRQSRSRFQKNISYSPSDNRVRGFNGSDPDKSRLSDVLRKYSAHAIEFLSALLPNYAKNWRVDLASFRPIEERNRKLPWRDRNDLIHIDAFPTRPSNGDRILRIFTNINLSEPRTWVTTDGFGTLAQRFAVVAGLEKIATRSRGSAADFRARMLKLTSSIGIPVVRRSPYDRFMLVFHDWLKANAKFQQECRKITLEFPPNSTWVAFTDAVPHAVIAGQFALEQTFMVPCEALESPDLAPIRILEQLCGMPLSSGPSPASASR